MMMTRTFASSTAGPVASTASSVKPEDVISQVLLPLGPADHPVRYADLFPFTFRPNPLPPSYQLNYSMGLGSG